MSSTKTYIRLPVVCAMFIWVFLAFGQEAQAAKPPPSAQCIVQPSGVITPQMAEGFRTFWPLYTQIAAREGVDNILIAPIHYREHFGLDNPSNGQGIFQLYSLVKSGGTSFPSTRGAPVAEPDFVHQGQLAVQALKAKSRTKLTIAPDPTLVKQVYYGYNGRNRFYASQARPGEGPWDGSPYVMNIPGVRELIMMTQDGGRGPRRLDPRPGAFPIYEELARQCAAPPPAPPTLDTATPPEPPQTSGYDFLGFLDSTFSNKGHGMKDFQFDYHPMHFGGELSLLLVALFAAVGLAYLIRFGKWKRPGGMLVLATLGSASLAAALLADKFGTGWTFGLFGQNLLALGESVVSWATYSARVTALKQILAGVFLAFIAWLTIKVCKAGKSAPREVATAFKPLIIGSWKLVRHIAGWHHLWLMVAAITALMVTATRLDSDMWAYGSTTVAITGIGIIIYLNRKSVLDIQDASES